MPRTESLVRSRIRRRWLIRASGLAGRLFGARLATWLLGHVSLDIYAGGRVRSYRAGQSGGWLTWQEVS